MIIDHRNTQKNQQDSIRSSMEDYGEADENFGEEEEHPGPLKQTPSEYSVAFNSLRKATDEVSGALSDCSFGTMISASSRAYSLPMETCSDRDAPEASLQRRMMPNETPESYKPHGRSTRLERSPFASVKPPNRKKSARKRSGRLLLAKNLVKDATDWLEIGEDEKALKAYQQAIQIAGSEIARINVKIRTCASHVKVVQRSIKDRLAQDLRKVGVSIGKLRTKMAIVYERLGDYDNAILCCQEAKALYANLPNADGTKSSSPSKLVGVIETMIQQLQSTKTALSERTDLLHELEAFRAEADKTQDPQRRNKCFGQMEKIASAVMTLEVKVLGACHPQVADSLQLLSTISLEKSNPVRAIHYLDQAIAISQECLGEKHPRIGQYCLRLARICQSSGAETKALENFEKGIKVLSQSHSTKYSKMLGSTMNDIAVLFMRRGENNTALEKLHLALKYYSSKCDRPKDGVVDDIIQVHQNMATCYMAEGNFGRAQEIYSKVLDLQNDSLRLCDDVEVSGLGSVDADENLTTVIREVAIAQTLVNLGRAAAAEGDHEEAIRSFQKALGMFNVLVAEEGIKAGSRRSKYVEYKRRITKILFCIAGENVAIGNLDEAMKFYTESIGIYCLLGEDLQSVNADHVAHCNLGISKVFCERNDVVSAHRLLKKTMRYCLNGKIKAAEKTMQAVRTRLDEVEASLKKPTEECLTGVEENAKLQIKARVYDAALLNLKVALSIRGTKLSSLKAMKQDVSKEVEGISNLLDMFGLVSILS